MHYYGTVIMVQGSPSLLLMPDKEKRYDRMRRASGYRGTWVCVAEHEEMGVIKLQRGEEGEKCLRKRRTCHSLARK